MNKKGHISPDYLQILFSFLTPFPAWSLCLKESTAQAALSLSLRSMGDQKILYCTVTFNLQYLTQCLAHHSTYLRKHFFGYHSLVFIPHLLV